MSDITEEQFYQCYGLVVASIELEKKRTALCDAFVQIVGEENRDRFWEYYDSVTESELKKGLQDDGFTIQERSK